MAHLLNAPPSLANLDRTAYIKTALGGSNQLSIISKASAVPAPRMDLRNEIGRSASNLSDSEAKPKLDATTAADFYNTFKSELLQIPGLPLDNGSDDEFGFEFDAARNKLNTRSEVRGGSRVGASQQGRLLGNLGPVSQLARGTGLIEEQDEVSMVESKIIVDTGDNLRDRLALASKGEKAADKSLRKQVNISTTYDVKSVKEILESGADVNLGQLSQTDPTQGSSIGPTSHEYKVQELLDMIAHGDPKYRLKMLTILYKYRRGPNVMQPRKCSMYSPNYTVNPYESPLEYLRCMNCNCSLNAHAEVRFKVAINDLSLNYQSRLTFFEDMLNSNQIVLIIRVKAGEGRSTTDSTTSIYFQQMANQGLRLKDQRQLNIRDVEIGLFKRFYLENCPLDHKELFEDFLEHPVLDSSQARYFTSKQLDSDASKVGDKRHKTDTLLNRIQTLVRGYIQLSAPEDRHSQHQYVVALLSCTLPNQFKLIESILSNSKKTFKDAGLDCFYHSSTRKGAILDKQVFFPYLFRAEKKFNIHIPAKDDAEVLFEELSSFRDTCDLNSTMMPFCKFNNLKGTEVDRVFEGSRDLRDQSQIKKLLKSYEYLGLSQTLSFSGMAFKEYSKQNQHLYRIGSPDVVNALSSQVFGRSCKDYQMAVVVLRPFIITNGLEEIFLNVFRTNGFIIVDRAYLKPTIDQLTFLARAENIEESSFDNYCKIMTTGNSICVVAMWNFMGVPLASFLADGYRDFELQGKYIDNSPEALKADSSLLLDLLFRSKGKPSEEVLEEFMASEQFDSFVSMNRMVNYNYVFYRDLVYDVLPKLSKETHPADRIINQSYVTPVYKTYRDFAQGCTFSNPNMYVPRSEKEANELVSLFLPHCLTKTGGLIILHPRCFGRLAQMEKMLQSLEYNISWKSMGQISPLLLTEFELLLESRGIRHSHNHQTLEKEWLSKSFHMIRVSRVSGKLELERVFYDITLNYLEQELGQVEDITRENAHSFGLLCPDEPFENFFYKASLSKLPLDPRPLNYSATADQTDQARVELANFAIEELTGLDQIHKEELLGGQTSEQVYSSSTKESILTLRTKRLPNKPPIEVRLTSIQTDNLEAYERQKRMGLNSTKVFYETLIKKFPSKVPAFSHSRIIAYDPRVDSPSAKVDQMNKLVIEVEEGMGEPFYFEVIHHADQYLKEMGEYTFEDDLMHRKQFTKGSLSQLENKPANRSLAVSLENNQQLKRRRTQLIGFVWGAILATFARKIETTNIRVALQSELYQQIRIPLDSGLFGLSERAYKQQEQHHYSAILSTLKARFPDKVHLARKSAATLNQIFSNEVYHMFREEEVMSFSPKYLDVEQLRSYRFDHEMPELIVRSQFELLEKGPSYDFAIQGVESGIYGRYRLHAQLEFILEHQIDQYFTIYGRDTLKGLESCLAPSLLEGFKTNYKILQEDQLLLSKLYSENYQNYLRQQQDLNIRKYGTQEGPEDIDLKNQFETRSPLDVIKLEQFLYLADLADRCLAEITYLQARLHELTHGQMGASHNETLKNASLDNSASGARLPNDRNKGQSLGGLPVNFLDPQQRGEGRMYTSSFLNNSKLGHSSMLFNTSKQASLKNLGDIFKTINVVNTAVHAQGAYMFGPQIGKMLPDRQHHLSESPFNNEKLCKDRLAELDRVLLAFYLKLSDLQIIYTPSEEYLRDERMEFIPTKRYYVPVEEPKVQPDIKDDRFLVNLADNETQNVLEVFPEALTTFLNKNRLDRLQQRWFTRVPLRVHYLRPVPKDKGGILVEKDTRDLEIKAKQEVLFSTLRYY